MAPWGKQENIMKIKRLGRTFLLKIRLIQPKPLLFDVSRSERIAEYAWVLKNLDLERGRILDVGCYGTLFPIMLASLGYEVIGIDLKTYEYKHPNFTFIKGDILNPPPHLLTQRFDVITSISAIEHVGLGSKDMIEDGDIRAVKMLRSLLREGGILFLTFGYGGRFQIHKRSFQPNIPFGRLYDDKRIEKLSQDFEVVKKEYFKLDKEGWKPCPFDEAKKFIYPEMWDKTRSITCIKLRKKG